MNHRRIILASLLSGLALCAQAPAAALATPGPQYDSSREVVLEGVVTGVKVTNRSAGPFVTLLFSAGGRDYEVLAGSAAKLKQNQVAFAKDDAITVVGIPLGNTLFVARAITKVDLVLTLLDPNGQPL